VAPTCSISEVVFLDVSNFEDLCLQSATDETMRSLQIYAGLYVQYMEDTVEQKHVGGRKSSVSTVHPTMYSGATFDSSGDVECPNGDAPIKSTKHVRIGGARLYSHSGTDVPIQLANSEDDYEEVITDLMIDKQRLEDFARRAFACQDKDLAKLERPARSSRLRIPERLGRLLGLIGDWQIDSKDQDGGRQQVSRERSSNSSRGRASNSSMHSFNSVGSGQYHVGPQSSKERKGSVESFSAKASLESSGACPTSLGAKGSLESLGAKGSLESDSLPSNRDIL